MTANTVHTVTRQAHKSQKWYGEYQKCIVPERISYLKMQKGMYGALGAASWTFQASQQIKEAFGRIYRILRIHPVQPQRSQYSAHERHRNQYIIQSALFQNRHAVV